MGTKNYEVGEIKFTRVYDEGAGAYQIIKIGHLKFKLHANTSVSMCMGFDSDMCAKVVLENGEIKNLFDAKSVGGYPKGTYCRDKETAKEQVNVAFAAMREHLKELYL